MNDNTAAIWGIEPGYHDVFGRWREVDAGTLARLVQALSAGGAPSSMPAAAPELLRAYQGDGRRIWGIAVQLYSVRSDRNWGIGDFRDLFDIVELAAHSGAGAVGLNPLHALFADDPERASPYAPNSRLFLNPLYIDVDSLPEFPGAEAAGLSGAIAAARESPLVDYSRVAALKLNALRLCHAHFVAAASAARRAAFAAFRAARGEALTRFACFEVLRQRYGANWRTWPPPFADPDAATLAQFERAEAQACDFHAFLQWLADMQLADCSARARALGMPIGLYLDLAVGVEANGADAWSNRADMLEGFSVGAPPDAFNPAGQDWGLLPYNPHRLPHDDYAVFRALLSAVMRHAGAVRLDHVLGLMRLYVIPHGTDAAAGAYIRFPFEPLLRVVAEESHRFSCIFIGEDLGTVPEGFRETAARWGVWSYRVMMFERGNDGAFCPPADYPAEALATFNTHDLASFRGWLQGSDLAVKRGIGVDPGESEEERGRARAALQGALAQIGIGAPEDFAGIAAFLAATPARLVMVAAEDLLDVADQVNIPGTVTQHPNWRRKLPVPLSDWEMQPTWRNVAAVFAASGRGLAAP